MPNNNHNHCFWNKTDHWWSFGVINCKDFVRDKHKSTNLALSRANLPLCVDLPGYRRGPWQQVCSELRSAFDQPVHHLEILPGLHEVQTWLSGSKESLMCVHCQTVDTANNLLENTSSFRSSYEMKECGFQPGDFLHSDLPEEESVRSQNLFFQHMLMFNA